MNRARHTPDYYHASHSRYKISSHTAVMKKISSHTAVMKKISSHTAIMNQIASHMTHACQITSLLSKTNYLYHTGTLQTIMHRMASELQECVL